MQVGRGRDEDVPSSGRPAVLLVVLCIIITLIQTYYVGDVTIYAREVEQQRLAMHEAILRNQPPKDGWTAVGNRVNVRLLPVYVAELATRVTGRGVLRIYKALDMLALSLTLLVVYIWLRTWFEVMYCVVGILYLGCILPLTYALHFFHPWDRLGLLFWALGVWAITRQHLATFTLVYLVSILNKFDTVVLPLLYVLAAVSATRWLTVLALGAGLMALGLAVYVSLQLVAPGGFEEYSMVEQLRRNVRELLAFKWSYPPLLGFALPVTLGALGIRRADRFARASFAFAILLFIPLLLATNFVEIRAEMASVLLMLPASLYGLKDAVATPSEARV